MSFSPYQIKRALTHCLPVTTLPVLTSKTSVICVGLLSSPTFTRRLCLRLSTSSLCLPSSPWPAEPAHTRLSVKRTEQVSLLQPHFPHFPPLPSAALATHIHAYTHTYVYMCRHHARTGKHCLFLRWNLAGFAGTTLYSVCWRSLTYWPVTLCAVSHTHTLTHLHTCTYTEQ